jgi:hypothetical protein
MNHMAVKTSKIFWWIGLLEKIFGIQLVIITTPRYRSVDGRYMAFEKVISSVRDIFNLGYLGGMERLARHLTKRQEEELALAGCHESLNGIHHDTLSREAAENIFARQKAIEAKLSE